MTQINSNIDIVNMECNFDSNKTVVVDLTTTVPEIAEDSIEIYEQFTHSEVKQIQQLLSLIQTKLQNHSLASVIELDKYNPNIGYIDVLQYNSNIIILTYVISFYEFINDVKSGYNIDYLTDLLVNDLIESMNWLD